MTPRRQPRYKRVFARLTGFNTRQRLTVCGFLSELVDGERIAALIDQIARARLACPHCDCNERGRHGFAYGLQR